MELVLALVASELADLTEKTDVAGDVGAVASSEGEHGSTGASAGGADDGPESGGSSISRVSTFTVSSQARGVEVGGLGRAGLLNAGGSGTSTSTELDVPTTRSSTGGTGSSRVFVKPEDTVVSEVLMSSSRCKTSSIRRPRTGKLVVLHVGFGQNSPCRGRYGVSRRAYPDSVSLSR